MRQHLRVRHQCADHGMHFLQQFLLALYLFYQPFRLRVPFSFRLMRHDRALYQSKLSLCIYYLALNNWKMRTEILQRQSAVLLRILHWVWCLWPCLWIRKDRTRKALWATVRHGTHVLTSSKEIARRALAGLLALQSCHHPLLPHLLLLLLQSLLKLSLLLLLLIMTKGEISGARLLLLLL